MGGLFRRCYDNARKSMFLFLALFVCGAAVWNMTRGTGETPLPLPETVLLQEGDWVFRSGKSADSLLVRRLGGGAYSHVGIISRTKPQVMVVHAVSGEGAAYPDAVLETPLAEFLSAERADAAAVGRPRFLTAEQRKAAARSAARRIGEPFAADSRDKPHLYCTTLLADAVAGQGAAMPLDWTVLDVAVFRGEYLFPEALRKQDLEWVYRFPDRSEP